MPSLSERNRNNVRAGIFVTIALAIGLGVMIALTDAVNALSRSLDRYTVTFDVSTGVNNLKRGSDVRVGGVKMGKVKSITPDIERGQAFKEIAVEFTVDHQVQIFKDAQILVSSALVGADAWLDIPSVGTSESGSPPGGQLIGTPSIGLINTLLGSKNAGKADEMVENVRKFSGFLADVRGEYNERIVPTIDNLKATSTDVRSVVSDIRQTRWPSWAESIDKVMTWATGASGKLDAAIADGQGLLSDGRAVVAENREPLKQTIANVESTSEALKTETVAKVNKLLDTGQQGLDQAVGALEELRVDYGTWATSLDDFLANANLSSQQLKLASIEIRRSPWKLFYRPSPTELEHEMLYEAARSFAVAAADLKAASESVRRVLDEHGNEIKDNEQAYRRLQDNLLKSLEHYEKAQQQLLDILVTDSKH